MRRDEAASCWRMWYYCRSSAFPGEVAPAFGTGAIATAVSEDGVHWCREDGPLAGGAVFLPAADPRAFDSTHVGTGDVIRYRDRWLMAYFGGNDEVPAGAKEMYTHPGYSCRLGLAESSDGINWTRLPGPAAGGAIVEVDESSVYAAFPSLVVVDDGLMIHYTSVDKLGRYHSTHMLRSRNLESWHAATGFIFESDVLPHESAGIVNLDIVESPFSERGRWLMVYTARDGRPETAERRSICAAYSDDLIAWRRHSPLPFFTVGTHGAWDSAGVASPKLVITPEDFRLYYYGWSNASHSGHPARGIGCAVSATRRLNAFRRVQPVIG
ncbi:MAG: hypothetical protein WD448_03255 [Woeseia sp.]